MEQFSQNQSCSACNANNSLSSNVCCSCDRIQWPMSCSRASKHNYPFSHCPGSSAPHVVVHPEEPVFAASVSRPGRWRPRLVLPALAPPPAVCSMFHKTNKEQVSSGVWQYIDLFVYSLLFYHHYNLVHDEVVIFNKKKVMCDLFSPGL